MLIAHKYSADRNETYHLSIDGQRSPWLHVVPGIFEMFTRMEWNNNAWWRHQMETFSALLALCAGNSPVPVNSPHKGQWRGALMFSLMCVRINDWVNNREAGDVRRHSGHYDVSVIGAYHYDFTLAIKRNSKPHIGTPPKNKQRLRFNIYTITVRNLTSVDKLKAPCMHIDLQTWWGIFAKNHRQDWINIYPFQLIWLSPAYSHVSSSSSSSSSLSSKMWWNWNAWCA